MREINENDGFRLLIDRKAGVQIVTIPAETFDHLGGAAGMATFLVEAQQDIEGLIEGEERPRIIVNFDRVKAVNSGVLGLMVQLDRIVRDKGGQFLLAGLAPDVSTVFSITHLDKLLKIHPTVEDALRAMN